MAAGSPVEALKQVPLFAGLEPDVLERLSQQMKERTFRAGSTVTSEGAGGVGFFVIADGDATVSVAGEVSGTLGPGDYFGELALLHRGPRSATVTAANPMHLFVLGQREFAGLVDSVPGLSSKLLTGLAQRLREADARNYAY